jgi:hypothetical protein
MGFIAVDGGKQSKGCLRMHLHSVEDPNGSSRGQQQSLNDHWAESFAT